MKALKTVAIVGTGLIGSSLGLALKQKKLAARVVGISRKASTLDAARRKGAIDEGSRNLVAVREADLIVLCLPVGGILRLAPRIAELAKHDAVILDTGSTKSDIVRRYRSLTRRFVGCHPMAGSEKRGPLYSRADLFEGSMCVITPAPRTDRQALALASRFWRALCRKTVVMTPEEHDRIMAAVSHLPHAAAFALANTVPARMLPFAATGFRDTTRLAGSHEEIWEDIFLTNRAPLCAWLEGLEKNLELIRCAVRAGDAAGLRRLLRSARKARERLTR